MNRFFLLGIGILYSELYIVLKYIFVLNKIYRFIDFINDFLIVIMICLLYNNFDVKLVIYLKIKISI